MIKNSNGLKTNKGFTLLMAIVITSMLLLVSFVVANISLKQLVLSYSGQESQYSFYNADSALECAMYWDLKQNPSQFDTAAPGSITCNGQNISNSELMDTLPVQKYSSIGGGGTPMTNYASSGTASAPVGNEFPGGLYPASGVTNGDQTGASWGNGSNGGWNNKSQGSYPATIQVDFSSVHTIRQIVVYTLPNGFSTNPTTDATDYGIKNFDVRTCDASSNCTTVASVTGNTLAMRKFTFAPISNVATVQIVVNAVNNNGGGGDYARVLRIEALGGGGVGSASPSMFEINYTHGCAIVTVTKQPSGTTLIESRGYNTCDITSDRRFERGIKISY